MLVLAAFICTSIPIAKASDHSILWLSPTTQDLHSVCATGQYSAYAVGKSGTIIQFGPIDLGNRKSPTKADLYSIHMLDDTIGWAVGLDTNYNGVMITYLSGTWSNQTSHDRLIDGSPHVQRNPRVCGRLGWNSHPLERNWLDKSYHPNIVEAQISIARAIVGHGGTTIRWDGASWTNVTSPTSATLYSIFVVTAVSGWAVGSSGAII